MGTCEKGKECEYRHADNLSQTEEKAMDEMIAAYKEKGKSKGEGEDRSQPPSSHGGKQGKRGGKVSNKFGICYDWAQTGKGPAFASTGFCKVLHVNKEEADRMGIKLPGGKGRRQVGR